jgi:hypothetical protein
MAKFDANWWFGKNSVYASSGVKEKLTGVKTDTNLFGDFKVPMEIDLTPEMKLTIGVVLFLGVGVYLAK